MAASMTTSPSTHGFNKAGFSSNVRRKKVFIACIDTFDNEHYEMEVEAHNEADAYAKVRRLSDGLPEIIHIFPLR